MRKRWLIDLLAVTVLLVYGWTTRSTEQGAADPIWTAVQERGVLRVGVDPGFKPFAQARDGQLHGYDIDLATELARRLGLRAEFVTVGYDALYDSLQTRRVDLLAAALPLAPEQGWRARFSTPYLNAGQVLVVRGGSDIKTQAQLVDHTVGVALGSDGDTLARSIRSSLPTLRVQSRYDTPAAALDALAQGAVDAVITDAVSALAATNANRALVIPTALTVDPYVLAVGIEAYQLERETNRALDAMRRDGVFDQLNARWFKPALLQ